MAKIQIYDIEWSWCDEPNEPRFSQVCVGFCPFEEWGDDMDKWTSNQTRFDESIWHFFEDVEELKEYTQVDGDWFIKSYSINGEPFDSSTI
mgnify:CR=1 FL=1